MVKTILGTLLVSILLGLLFGLTWFYWVVVGFNNPIAFWVALASLIAILSIIPASVGDS